MSGTPLVLVTASGLAREVLAMLRMHPMYQVVGFVDDDPVRQGTTVDCVPVLGPVQALRDRPDVQVLVCAGRGSVREALVGRLEQLGVDEQRYATVVHPGVEVPPGCSVGAGSILLAGTVLTAAVTVGRHVAVMPHVTLTHDDVVEDYATVCAGVHLAGRVRVGRAAYLGTGSTVREDVQVGAGATLGMGAALVDDLPAGQTWAGVPARHLAAAVRAPRHGVSARVETTDDGGPATAPDEQRAGAA